MLLVVCHAGIGNDRPSPPLWRCRVATVLSGEVRSRREWSRGAFRGECCCPRRFHVATLHSHTGWSVCRPSCGGTTYSPESLSCLQWGALQQFACGPAISTPTCKSQGRWARRSVQPYCATAGHVTAWLRPPRKSRSVTLSPQSHSEPPVAQNGAMRTEGVRQLQSAHQQSVRLHNMGPGGSQGGQTAQQVRPQIACRGAPIGRAPFLKWHSPEATPH